MRGILSIYHFRISHPVTFKLTNKHKTAIFTKHAIESFTTIMLFLSNLPRKRRVNLSTTFRNVTASVTRIRIVHTSS